MTPLQSLKQILEEHLEVWQENEAYKEALSDAQYACDLSEIALVEHMNVWLENSLNVPEEDIEYIRGVQFVNDQWNIIKEKEDECIN